MTVDIARLRVFRAVVAHGSIGGAATALGYTPSAISQQLTVLQRETGLELIERNGRGIAPTAIGQSLSARSDRLFSELAALEHAAQDLRTGKVGSLTISYFASASVAWVSPIVATLMREFPGVRMSLVMIELLPAPGLQPDIEIFVQRSEDADPAGYRSESILREPYLAVVPADHRLAGRRSVDLRELREEIWVDNDHAGGPCRQVPIDACTAAGFTPNFAIQTLDYPTAINFVGAGVGITVLPALATRQLPDTVRGVLITNPTPMRTVAIRTRQSIRDSPAAQRFLHLLRERVAADSAPDAVTG